MPLPPGTKPVNAPLFALKAFAAGTLLCAVGSSAAVLAYAYATDTWSVRTVSRRTRPPCPRARSALTDTADLWPGLASPQIEQFGDRMRKEIPPRAQKIRDWMAPLRKRLGTDQPRPSDGADGSEGFPWK